MALFQDMHTVFGVTITIILFFGSYSQLGFVLHYLLDLYFKLES